jgi:hypothetical protein
MNSAPDFDHHPVPNRIRQINQGYTSAPWPNHLIWNLGTAMLLSLTGLPATFWVHVENSAPA